MPGQADGLAIAITITTTIITITIIIPIVIIIVVMNINTYLGLTRRGLLVTKGRPGRWPRLNLTGEVPFLPASSLSECGQLEKSGSREHCQ